MTSEIDWETPRDARLSVSRPCVVCGLRADVLLCRECLADVSAARVRVRTWLAANLDAGRQIIATFDTFRESNQAAWDRIQDSQANDPPYTHISKCAEHVKKGNIYGKLLEAKEAYKLALAPLGIERARLEKALEIIEGLDIETIVATCRDCHTTFEDLSGHSLCDRCLAEHINGAGILELDDE